MLFSHPSQSISFHSIAFFIVVIVPCLSRLLPTADLADLRFLRRPLPSLFLLLFTCPTMGSSRGRTSGGNSSSTDTSDRQLRHRSQPHDKNLDYPPAADVESLSDSSSDSDESDSASPVEERKRETQTMNSWPKLSKYTGLQRTQVKHLLVSTPIVSDLVQLRLTTTVVDNQVS